jgi:uncharacterized repeat protein (TIGR03803 family)
MLTKLKYLKSYWQKQWDGRVVEYIKLPIARDVSSKSERIRISTTNLFNTGVETITKDTVRILDYNTRTVVDASLPIFNKIPPTKLVDQFAFNTTNGGLYKYDLFTGDYTKVLNMSTASNGPILASDGNFYGVSRLLGANTFGFIYKYDAKTKAVTILYNFLSVGAQQGIQPGNLTQGVNGKLYGTTLGGSTTNSSIIFEYDIFTNTFAKKYDFEVGTQTYDSFVLASNGKMYGVTQWSVNSSTPCYLFEYDPIGNTVTNRMNLSNQNAAYTRPVELNGILYGTCRGGGANGNGFIYSYNITTLVSNIVFNFPADNLSGHLPVSRLTVASNNKIYGFTQWRAGNGGTGVFFEFNPVGPVFTVLKIMGGTDVSGGYTSQLIEIGDRVLYATNLIGNRGVTFVYDLKTNTYTTLKSVPDTVSYSQLLPIG